MWKCLEAKIVWHLLPVWGALGTAGGQTVESGFLFSLAWKERVRSSLWRQLLHSQFQPCLSAELVNEGLINTG